MNDLPLFLQMFVRMFAALALGVSVYLFVDRPAEETPEAGKARVPAASNASRQTAGPDGKSTPAMPAAKTAEQPKR